MRLLNVQSFKFREFYSNIPKYVIASHRWFPDTEVGITDISQRTNTEKLGYKKVQGFVRYTKTWIPHVEWLWIDTCCINQESSQEVSEAINSMFKWYMNAEVCLAYMADVGASDDIDSFTNSKWFTRGWTLQELLAPNTVIFLTKDWEVIGHKGGRRDGKIPMMVNMGAPLDVLVTTVTGISGAILDDFRHSKSLTVEERFQWMSKRRTTREEDTSYCLLGIFDVSLIANYGEGREKARKRLLAEISNEVRNADTALTTLQEKAVLGNFPVSARATYNSFAERDSARCLTGTRSQLIHRIVNWTADGDEKCIFWLCGKAGTGKSTIARTIAQALDKEGLLAATFFFKRGEGDRGSASRFFPTITFQLATAYPELSPSIVDALKKDPFLCERNLEEQFENFIQRPLLAMMNMWARPLHINIIIDALDECEGNVDVRTILSLLARLNNITAFCCRVFVTSRPELPIKLGFRRISSEMHHDIILEDAQAETIGHDIHIYLRHRFRDIRDEYSLVEAFDTLPIDWPGEEKIQALVDLAVPLFIFAVTACRYISRSDPVNRLDRLLRQQHDIHVSGLEGMYHQILDQYLERDGQRDDQAVIAFQKIVGSLILLAQPLSVVSLSKLLGISIGEIGEVLNHLHSVLYVPSNQCTPLRLLHVSFRDHLILAGDKDKDRLGIDERETHRRLAERCLTLLAQPGVMKQDLCNVKDPGFVRTATDKDLVEDALKPDVAYACCYWVHHLHQSNAAIQDGAQVHVFLETSFLYWMEALSWLGKLPEFVGQLDKLRFLVNTESGVSLSAFLHDARRFVLRYWQAVHATPLQLYSSAMMFTPKQSLVRQQFQKHIPEWIQLSPMVSSTWGAELQKLEGHEGWIRAVAFSYDDGLLVSASHDNTIRIWNTTTGQQIQKLRGHNDQVNAVVFSPDSRFIASASADMTIKIWDMSTWEELRELTGHEDWINALAVSHDGRLLASGSGDMTIRLWEPMNSHEMMKLEGHTGWVNAVAFSRCNQLLASGSRDQTIRLWDLASGEEVQRLEGHSDSLNALDFSHNGKLLVSGSYDTTVRLWELSTGREISKLESHNHWVRGVAFSYDDEMLASCSHDGTICVWDPATGCVLQTLRGHSDSVNCVTFAHSSLLLASASGDQTVRLWGLEEKEGVKMLDGHSSTVNSVCLSHNNLLIASISIDMSVRLKGSATNDKTIMIWSTTSGELLQQLAGHSDIVTVTAFSRNNDLLISGARDKAAIIWDVTVGSQLHKLKGHSSWVNDVAFTYDDRLVASASGDKTIKIWNTNTGNQVRTLEGHTGSVNILAFSFNDRFLISASGDRTIRLWEITSSAGESMRCLEGHLDTITAILFSSDNTLILSASLDETIRVWDVADGSVRLLKTHQPAITAIALSQDMRLLVSASLNKNIDLWDLTTGRKLQTALSDVAVRALSFSAKNSVVQTDRGPIALQSPMGSPPFLDLRNPRTIMLAKEWIMQGGKSLLWLPHDFRGSSSIVTGSTFVIGQSSGHMTVIGVKVSRVAG